MKLKYPKMATWPKWTEYCDWFAMIYLSVNSWIEFILGMDIRQNLSEMSPFLQCFDIAVVLWGTLLLLRICIFVFLACLEYAEHYKQIEPLRRNHKLDQQRSDPKNEEIQPQ